MEVSEEGGGLCTFPLLGGDTDIILEAGELPWSFLKDNYYRYLHKAFAM